MARPRPGESSPRAQVDLPYRFTPRSYQRTVLAGLEAYKRSVLVIHRRGTKSTMAVNHTVAAAWKRVGSYFLICPTFAQARRIYWDGLTHDGRRLLLGYIQEELLASVSENEMQIVLTNGSVIQLMGADQADRLRGTNPVGVIFDEYALMPTSEPWDICRPVLAENDGFAVFCFTPKGRNHAHALYEMARLNPEWFTYLATVADTRRDAEGENGRPVVTAEQVERERAEGMPDELIQQEFYCSFNAAIAGAYYAKELQRAELEGRIDAVPWISTQPVHTAWDLGVGDATVIVAFQLIGASIHVIDAYESHGEGLAHYVGVLQQWARDRHYVYGKHYAPHDIGQREFGTGLARWDQAKHLGVRFQVLDRGRLEDGIAAGRAAFARARFDKTRCRKLLDALANYRSEWSEEKQVLALRPRHDWSSHYADAWRYLAMSIKEPLPRRDGGERAPTRMAFSVFDVARGKRGGGDPPTGFRVSGW